MGLINWFKDKIILQIEHDLKLVQADIKVLQSQFDHFEENVTTKLNSLRGQINRSKTKDEEEQNPEEKLTPEMREFLNGLPPWERQRLNNSDFDMQ